MNPRLPAVSARAVIRVLEQSGWELDRISGSHHVFRHPDYPTRVVVPLHGGDLRKGTLNAIISGSGLTRGVSAAAQVERRRAEGKPTAITARPR